MCGICQCAESVVCCCFSCAWNLFISLVSGILILLVIIGVIVYFTVFHDKDNTSANHDTVEQIHKNLTQLIRETVDRTRNQIA